ncbi:class I SAM-dependent methyltransferase [Paracoccus jeotgali]|uniref:class I SAM-dependent methyltransferase n=1 Tax=Paracoccus jeotgali TaxID=2065379 RepID=UPI0028AC8507|nr:class I SAM-dependent methyltransferase [Paracoccus jeotgali]
MPNYFRDYMTRTGDRMILKMDHYLDIYPRLLGHLQGRDLRFLEIGIYKGGSMPMWQGYFGPGAHLVFADIDPACRDLALPGTHVEIGDQADPAFLRDLVAGHGPFDLILDDGGHKTDQQITSFRHLFPHLRPGGIYVVEDTHTSYWPGFDGGYGKRSFIGYAKWLIDRMHSWYTDEDEIFPFHPLAREIGEIRFFDSIVAITREPHGMPTALSSRNGQVKRSQAMMRARNRRSIF